MKCLALSLILTLACQVDSFAQATNDGPAQESSGGDRYLLHARVNDNQVPAVDTSSGWRKIGRGLARAAKVAVTVTAVTASEALRAYAEYSDPSSYTSPYVPTYAGDSCVHGYTTATCPYGYNGRSNGTTYLSGSNVIRVRPDGLGNYRYYMSDGRSGRATRDYMGAYRLTTTTGRSIVASSTALEDMGYGISSDDSW